MADRIALLDHGHLELVESWGSDERIIEAARMSTGKGFLGWGPRCPDCGIDHDAGSCNVVNADWPTPLDQRPAKTREHGDEKLLAYLWNNKHATPFEMAGLVVEVQAPIFVFREWHRHRTQSYNEMSARYMPLPDVNYIPTIERLMLGGGHLTKQAGTIAGAGQMNETRGETFRAVLDRFYAEAEAIYQEFLAAGVPKELARIHLPVGRYSRMRASANLRNWLAFLTLRMAPQAQWEIRQYANAVGSLIAEAFPRTWELFAGGLKT